MCTKAILERPADPSSGSCAHPRHSGPRYDPFSTSLDTQSKIPIVTKI